MEPSSATFARKGKKRVVEESDIKARTGMALDVNPPRETVHVFLSRYAGRGDLRKGEEYEYSCLASVACGGMFMATLTAWVFNNKTYTGLPQPTEKLATISAADCFLSHPDVIAAAAALPPPAWLLRRRALQMSSGWRP